MNREMLRGRNEYSVPTLLEIDFRKLSMGFFSIPTISALVEVITGGPGMGQRQSPPIGLYRTGPQLEQFLGTSGIELIISNKSRVPAVREALMRENEFAESPDNIINLIEQVTDPREYISCPEKESAVVDYLNKRFCGDGHKLQKVGQRYKLLPFQSAGSVTASLSEAVIRLSFESVQQDFDRALSQAETDPEDAVTSACSTLESVCKCLLDEIGQAYPDRQDISGLVKAVSFKLNLSPSMPDIVQDLKQMLGGLTNVCSGIGALRTHCGNAHGRGKQTKRVDSRIARFAIHAAGTISIFLIETWKKTFNKN